jgi:hypothetical protein
MKSSLARKLIEKGVIRQGTVFEAYHSSKGLSCTDSSRVVGRFAVSAAKQNTDKTIYLEAISEDGKSIKRFSAEDVISLDGMEIVRLLKIYDVSEDGVDMVPAKRRGRKPKSLLMAEAADEDLEEE